jgi:hypothetical protein
MERKNIIWILFSLFVWLHLVYGIYPLPFQRTEEINQYAAEAVENSAWFSNDKYSQMTEEEWVTALTKNYWSTWIINLF